MPTNSTARIGVGPARPGEPRADAVDHRIGADRHRGEQREADRAGGRASRDRARPAATAAARRRRAARCRPSRRGRAARRRVASSRSRSSAARAARDRIDLTEVAGAIAFDQAGEIEQVDDDRGDQPRPGGRLPACRRTARTAAPPTPAPSAISTVVASGSSVRLMLAFQPAWQAAANSTARKTNGVHQPAGRRSSRRSSASRRS